ncbi:glycosyltransferase family protein [Halioxenophilus aromaticivorans]|uniref:Spore protein YkvP/CgeB glycosyl transferase-like domain-containing protein n=1 Tax=Halioxenophilus aromaticivorans TaxID=1306992 RepID=A0AAV3U2C1_9ALTE
MRIIHVAHQQLRKYGHNRVSWGQKLYFGLIRNGHCVQAFSDRDVAAFEAPMGIRDLGKSKANKRLLQTVEAFEPDLMIVGHCDYISNETLAEARKLSPNLVIAGCNNDPLFVPENVDKIARRVTEVDAMFVSTGEQELAQFTGHRAQLLHMPNPVDSSIETFDASLCEELPTDLLFCSKETAHTSRGELVTQLKQRLPDHLVFHTPGSFEQPGVWGRDYDRALADSKMGLNLNRQEGLHWYSSARMAQMVGNGLLTFTHASGGFHEFMPEETLVYFNDLDDLAQLVTEFNQDSFKRRYWADKARTFFHQEINSTLYAQYIVESAMELPYSHPYVWLQ